MLDNIYYGHGESMEDAVSQAIDLARNGVKIEEIRGYWLDFLMDNQGLHLARFQFTSNDCRRDEYAMLCGGKAAAVFIFNNELAIRFDCMLVGLSLSQLFNKWNKLNS